MPGSMSGGIFLSYRREDAAPYARLLQLQLSERFPGARVFMDLDSIEAGLDFAEVIREAVDSCAVLVALIGRQWTTLADEEGHRRLDNPDDYVRFEVETALERGVRVIPVLVDGAKPVTQQQLPPKLQKLARLNAFELSYGRYAYDAERLLDLIQQILATAGDVADVERQALDGTEGKATEEATPPAQDQAERAVLEGRADSAGEAGDAAAARGQRRWKVAGMVAAALLVLGAAVWFFAIRPQHAPTNSACGAVAERFQGSQLDPSWQMANINQGQFALTKHGIAITANDGADVRSDIQGRVTAPFLSRHVRGDFSIETVVTVAPRYFYQAAGLLLFKDKNNYVRLERSFGTQNTITFEYAVNGRHINLHGPFDGQDPIKTSAATVELRLARNGTSVSAFWRQGALAWQALSGTAPLKGDVSAGVAVLNRAQPPNGDPNGKPLTATFPSVNVIC